MSKVVDIKSFLKQNVAPAEVEKEVKLARFPEPFVIASITEKENAVLKKAATEPRISKGGNMVSDLNTDKYIDVLLARSVVSPDLQDSVLQDSYGTISDAPGTLKAMLTAGEYTTLSKAVMDLNGFNDDEEIKEEVKK